MNPLPDDELPPRRRPLGAVLAVVLLAVVALGSWFVAVVLLALGRYLGGGVVEAGVATTAAMAVLYGIVAAGGLAGTWRGSSLGWAAALMVSIVGLLAIATAALVGAFVAPLVVGMALLGALLVLLALPATRSWCGIGSAS